MTPIFFPDNKPANVCTFTKKLPGGLYPPHTLHIWRDFLLKSRIITQIADFPPLMPLKWGHPRRFRGPHGPWGCGWNNFSPRDAIYMDIPYAPDMALRNSQPDRKHVFESTNLLAILHIGRLGFSKTQL